MTLKMVTASRLRDGVEVYLAADGGWSESIDEGRAVPISAEAAALLALGEQAARAREMSNETAAEPESTVCAAYWAY